jgi:peptidyl-prolyl cis-trans isomerase D
MYRFFKKNRDAIKRYLLIFFLSIVSIGMVITLAPIPNADETRNNSNVLAEIGGVNITSQDLQQTVRRALQGSQFANDPHMMVMYAETALNDMVLQHALDMEAKKLGVEVSNGEVTQSLQQIPWLYSNGSFIGMDRYQDLIQNQTGMSVSQFEGQLRQSLLQQKIRGVITDGVRVSAAEVHAAYLQRGAKAKIEYVVFDPANYLKAVPVTDAALTAYFNANIAKYKIPEERVVRYVLIDPDMVKAQTQVDDSELRQYYSQHLNDYKVPDRVNVAHILFKTTGKTPAEVALIDKTAQNVLDQIRKGANFNELAKKYSEDSSASNGGNLGWIVRGQTVKNFEDTAFSMKPGEVSGLVKTEYGIHIIKVLEKQTAHLQTFTEVENDIRQTLEKQKIAEAEQALSNQFETAARSNPEGFEQAAAKLGLAVKQTDPFKYNQTVPDFGNSEAFWNLAFQLKLNEVGDPISVAKGSAIIQAVKILPEHNPKLEEVRAQVEEDYRAQQSKVMAGQKAQDFATQAKTGDFKKVAQSMGLTVKESKDFGQQDYVEGLAQGSQLTGAFTLAPGQVSDVVSLPGSDKAVFSVISRTPADEAGFAAQEKQIEEQLVAQKQEVAFDLFKQNLKQEMQKTGDLKYYPGAMKQFLAAYEPK